MNEKELTVKERIAIVETKVSAMWNLMWVIFAQLSIIMLVGIGSLILKNTNNLFAR